MQKSLLILGIFFLNFGLSAFSAKAVTVDEPLLEVSAEKYPGETYHLGLSIDEQRQVQAVYFESGGNKTYFAFNDLKNGVALLETEAKNPLTGKTRNFDVISLQAAAPSLDQPSNVSLSYLCNGLFMRYAQKTVWVSYDLATKTYEVLNQDGQRMTKVFAATRYWNIFGHKFEVGIRSMDFSP